MIEYAQPEHRNMTLLERMTEGGISSDRATKLIADGLVWVGGHDEPVTDPAASCPKPTAWVIRASN